MSAVTITLSNSYSEAPLKIGQLIGCKDSNHILNRNQSIRTKRMIYRLKGKKYKPQFRVVSATKDLYSWSFNIKPYNF